MRCFLPTRASFARPAYRMRKLAGAALLATTLLATSCSRDAEIAAPTSPAADTYSADVATKWTDMELRLIKNGMGFSPPVVARALGYAGVCLYGAVQPGIAGSQSLAGQLTGLSTLPQPEAGQLYNWAVAANAAQALMAKSLFGNATTTQRTSIDSLETALNATYLTAAGFDRSVQFGRAVAQAVFDWSRTDGGHEDLPQQPAGGLRAARGRRLMGTNYSRDRRLGRPAHLGTQSPVCAGQCGAADARDALRVFYPAGLTLLHAGAGGVQR